MVLAVHRTAPWWWFLREPKHVRASIIILNCFNISIDFIIVCISWNNKKVFRYYWCTVQTWRLYVGPIKNSTCTMSWICKLVTLVSNAITSVLLSFYRWLMKWLIFFINLFIFYGERALSEPGPPNYRGFTITLRHTTLRSTLDDWSARGRDLCLTIHNTQTDIHASGGIRNRNSSERPKTHVLNEPATGISAVNLCLK